MHRNKTQNENHFPRSYKKIPQVEFKRLMEKKSIKSHKFPQLRWINYAVKEGI